MGLAFLVASRSGVMVFEWTLACVAPTKQDTRSFGF